MSKFLVEPRASMALGNTCAGCNTHNHVDGFVNTNLDGAFIENGEVIRTAQGRVYFCANCVREMAVLVGCLQPGQVRVLHGQLEEMSAAAERLMAEVEKERADKYVPLADVVDFFEERKKRRPDAPVPTTKKTPAVKDGTNSAKVTTWDDVS